MWKGEGGGEDGTCTAVHLTEGVCLILGPLNTGLTAAETIV